MSSPAVELLNHPLEPCPPGRPPTWAVLARALADRQPVLARYHGHERVLCPHALGWRGQRAKVLAYQVGGTTSTGALAGAQDRRWRSMFVDEIEGAVIVEGRWESPAGYRGDAGNGMDVVEVVLGQARAGAAGRPRG